MKTSLVQKTKSCLNRSPFFYSLLQRVYYKTLFQLETRVFGTRIHQWIWKSGLHRYTASSYSDIPDHPHRKHLIDCLSAAAPFESVLEIGCNAAPNVILLAREHPQVSIHGIDINPEAIAEGTERVKKQGLEHVNLRVGRADDLSEFRDQSVDVTFSDATLIYIGPDQIEKVVREMKRVTRKRILLNEWNAASGPSESFWYDLRWIHDYRSILSRHFPKENISISPLPPEIWGPGDWTKYGALIEVSL